MKGLRSTIRLSTSQAGGARPLPLEYRVVVRWGTSVASEVRFAKFSRLLCYRWPRLRHITVLQALLRTFQNLLGNGFQAIYMGGPKWLSIVFLHALKFKDKGLMNREVTVDMFRALAVLLVTSFHVWRAMGRPKFSLFPGVDLLSPLGNGWVGVGIFFVISGYCMGASAEKTFSIGWTASRYGRYLANRFLRIAPSYYVAILVWYVLINVYQVAVKPTGVSDMVTHFLFIHNLFDATFFTTSGVFWSIAVEMQLYIFLPFLIIFAPRSNARIGVLIGAAVLCLAVSVLPPQYRVIRWGVANYLFLFVSGWLMFCYKARVQALLDMNPAPYCLAALTVGSLFYSYEIVDGESKLYEAFVSLLAGLCMVWLMSREACFSHYTFCKVLSFVGQCSFSIYLYNYTFYALMPFKASPPVFMILLLSVVGFGVLMYYLVELQAEKLRRRLFPARNKMA